MGPFTWWFWHTATTTIYIITLRIIMVIIQFLLHTHTQKKVYLFSPLQQKCYYMQQFCILVSKQYTQFKRWLCAITFYSWNGYPEKFSTISVVNLRLPLSSISLDSHQSQIQQDETLDWPHIFISLKDNLSFWWIRLITIGHLPIKAEWLDAPFVLQVFSRSIANTPYY